MKYLSLVAAGFLIAGCVEADTPDKFKGEAIGSGEYRIIRTVDTEYRIVCYTTYQAISCVKL